MPDDTASKSSQQEYNEAKMYQGAIMRQGVAEVFRRLDAMDVDEYIDAIGSYFVSPDAIENFMRILMSCRDEVESTIVVRGRKYRIEPRKSPIFKKVFAEFLAREPKIMLAQVVKDPISLMAYTNGLSRARPSRKAPSIMDVFG